MKKFTKACLIIAAVLASVGILFCGIGTVMGGGYRAIAQAADKGELDFGRWHIRANSIYYGDDYIIYGENWVDDAADNAEPEKSKKAGESTADTDENTSVDGKKAEESVYAANQVKNLQMDIGAAKLVIKEGQDAENINVKLNKGYKKHFTSSLHDDTLKVSYQYPENNAMIRSDWNALITVELPRGMQLSETNLMIGAADVKFDLEDAGFSTETLVIDVGAGKLEADDIRVSRIADITIGAGNVELDGGEYQDISLDCGMGTFELDGSVNGNLDAECSMGSILIELDGYEEDYNYDLSCDMGELRINGTSYSGFSEKRIENTNADKTVTLKSSMGSVKLKTK